MSNKERFDVHCKSLQMHKARTNLGRVTLLDFNDADGFDISVHLLHIHLTDEHVVVHQSNSRLPLVPNKITVLFCISSTHCFASEYEWMCEALPTGVSSPVLYATRAGHYQCTVTLESTGETCFSGQI